MNEKEVIENNELEELGVVSEDTHGGFWGFFDGGAGLSLG